MTDALLPAPASICSQEVDCKWVRRNIGGSVIRLDIARDTVSVDLNIKSARGHTSIHMTPRTASPSTRDGATPTSPETGQQSKLMPSGQLKEKQGQFSPVAASVFIELPAGTEHVGDSLHRTLDLMNSRMIHVTTTPWNIPCPHKT